MAAVERENSLKERERTLHSEFAELLEDKGDLHEPTFWQAFFSSGLNQYQHMGLERDYDSEDGKKRIKISCIEPLHTNPIIIEDPSAGKKWLVGSYYKSMTSCELDECEMIFDGLIASKD